MGLTVIITLFKFLSHLVWRSNLKEQKQLVFLNSHELSLANMLEG
jgi:hypothetical protein